MTTQALEPGFMLVHGNRAEELCDIAVNWIIKNPLAPLEKETILVQSNGIAQWLRQQIASSGIAAALDFSLPSSFVWRAYRAILGADAVPVNNPLEKNNLTWRLLKLLEQYQEQNSALSIFLADADKFKKYQLAQHLADLYDQYQVYRADWLNHWQQGDDFILDKNGQKIGLDEADLWQPLLWRLILNDLQDTGGNGSGRAIIHKSFLTACLEQPANSTTVDLPRRILVFGISSMPLQVLESLVALSQYLQIIVFINNPCEHYWGDIMADKDLVSQNLRRQQKKTGVPEVLDPDSLHNYVQPLLASWGKQGRDFIAMLDQFDTPDRRQASANVFALIEQKLDVFTELPGASLLQQIQDDIRDLRPLQESIEIWPPVNTVQDKSVQFHSCYSPQREVEVLHNHLLRLFADNPELQASDIIVMVPEIDDYAASIQAVFDSYERNDKRYLPYTIADSGQRLNPLLNAIAKLLDLPKSRLTVTEVLDYFELDSICAKYGLAAADLPLLRIWVQEANIRWGLNQAHKADFVGANASSHNSWDFGALRMLLGYACGKYEQNWHDVLSYSAASSVQSELLGALANFLDKLEKYWHLLKIEHSPSQWQLIITQLLDDFFIATNVADEALLIKFRQILQDWVDICSEVNYTSKLPANVVTDFCLEQIDKSGVLHKFFAGAVTFATLMPMRAIPFKYIFLLGMDDDKYPRVKHADDFDLMSLYPRAGDRSTREDDRYLFLEALLSAREQLYISWLGRNINDNTEQPPSVLVAQLMDHIDSGWQSVDGADLLKELTFQHPLQPFSKKYFYSDKESPDLFTFAYEWGAIDQAASNKLLKRQPLEPLPVGTNLGLKDLKRFLRNPIQYFYNLRFNVYLNSDLNEIKEDEQYELNGLDKWLLKDSIFTDIINEETDNNDVLVTAERFMASGILPADYYGQLLFDDITTDIEPALGFYDSLIEQYPLKTEDSIIIEELINEGFFLTDSIKCLRTNDNGDLALINLQASDVVKSSKYRFKPLLDTWVEHLALCVYGYQVRSYVISPKGQISFTPFTQEQAKSIWESLWQLWQEGTCYPLPVEEQTAITWLRSNQPEPALQKTADKFAELLASDLYISRTYPDFESFYAGGKFAYLAQALYQDLNNNMQVIKA